MSRSVKIFSTVLLIALFLSLLLILLADTASTVLRHRREQLYYNDILRAAAEFDVPAALILAVIRTESDFRASAVSSAGAVGLMQLLPETFQDIGNRQLNELPAANTIYTPAVNIRYGTCYLAYLYQKFDDWPTALAAYNAGEGRVSAWLSDPELSPDGQLQTIPFPETARYVESAMRAFAQYRDKYNF